MIDMFIFSLMMRFRRGLLALNEEEINQLQSGALERMIIAQSMRHQAFVWR
jgi:hypothetical protein